MKNTKTAGIEMLHEATDGAALSGCVAAFEQNNDFLSSLLDPVLKKVCVLCGWGKEIDESYRSG